MPATKQQIRQIIADNNLNSVADVYSLLRDSFKDILQELYMLPIFFFLNGRYFFTIGINFYKEQN